jgi:F-type H+-transporting ATPase subunit c
MIYLAALALAVGFGLPIAVLAAATAQGKAIAVGLESMARQPESAAGLQTGMLIGLAFIELFILLAFVLGFLLLGKMPAISPAEAVQMAQTAVETVAH